MYVQDIKTLQTVQNMQFILQNLIIFTLDALYDTEAGAAVSQHALCQGVCLHLHLNNKVTVGFLRKADFSTWFLGLRIFLLISPPCLHVSRGPSQVVKWLLV